MRVILRSACFILSLFLCTSSKAQQSGYEVEVAAFNKYVSMDYFMGLQGITYYKDANDIHRYRMKSIRSLEDAKSKIAAAKSKGFNARIIDSAKEKALLAQCEQKLDHLFFDFDQSRLTSNAKQRLDDLATTLNRNPDFQAVLAGHTDAKGSNDYNNQLSRARVQQAMQYLLSQNVNVNQISTEFFGEQSPIAKNSLLNSKDLPTGRQFNRRVEVQIVHTASHKKLDGFVKKIKVPSELKY